jgi:hypothetical protein
MDSLDWPRGLIKYTSEKAQQGEKTRFLKAKNIGYGAAALGAALALVLSVVGQVPLDFSVEADAPAVVRAAVRWAYPEQLRNQDQQQDRPGRALRAGVEGLAMAELDLGQMEHLRLQPEQSLRILARVRVVPESGRRNPRNFRCRDAAARYRTAGAAAIRILPPFR